MDLKEKKLGRDLVYDGSLLKVYCDQVELVNGKKTVREWINHPGAAAVIPLLDGKKTILVKQFRYPIGRETLEIPAGKLDPGESPLECAARELREETGLFGGELIKIGSLVTTPAFTNEEIHLYVNRKPSLGCSDTDEGEFINTVLLPVKEVFIWIEEGKIKDAKTVMAFLLAKTKGLL